MTTLDPCGCCEDGVEPPARPSNPPGQSTLRFRLGTHGTFLRCMMARIPGVEIIDSRPLTVLTTRSPNDPAIGLLDAFATVADVLCFYQERIANEGFLRTAGERRSVAELAREIGYELNPGLAAATLAAFTVEDAQGAPGVAEIPAGTRVMSVPGQDQRPQTFETTTAISARAELNVLRAATTREQTLDSGTRTVYLQGVSTGLSRGDALLMVGAEREDDPSSDRWDLRMVESVEIDVARDRSAVAWSASLGPWSPAGEAAPADVAVYAMRRRASLFGHNAPDLRSLSEDMLGKFGNPTESHWPGTAAGETIDLDAEHPEVTAGGYVVLVSSDGAELYRAKSVAAGSRTDFLLTAKTTRIELDPPESLGDFAIRDTTAFIASEGLALARAPLSRRLRGNVIDLERPLAEGVERGRRLILRQAARVESGELVSAERVEAVVVDESAPAGATQLVLRHALANAFDRHRVAILANVAPATHGETVPDEILGSGDGASGFQRFALKRPPPTFVSAPTPTGASSTLDVRVDGVRWKEVASLYGIDSREHAYTVRVDDGTAAVAFGDGETAARLPSGQQNVRATYRTGLGLDGNVGADALTLLQTRPLGVREVTNPLAASGGDDPERLDDARAHAPLTVRTLERIVSLSDFADFAEAFSGIAKAAATTVWNGEARVVHLTVAGAGGEAVDPGSDVLANLVAAIDRVGDPAQQVLVAGYTSRIFGLTGSLLVSADRVAEDVRAAVIATLQGRFSFERRAFGQGVSAAEVIAAAQGVPGVEMVDLDTLIAPDRPSPSAQPPVVLPANLAHWESGAVAPAELLLLDPDAVALTARTP